MQKQLPRTPVGTLPNGMRTSTAGMSIFQDFLTAVSCQTIASGVSMGIERVIIVDSNDREIGTEEKLLAHQKGMLHRALSAFAVRPDGRMLLQRRTMVKYHSPGLWSTNRLNGGHYTPL